MTTHALEPASSGRSKCRACGKAIARGELRFGERLPSPFNEGEATYWFHLECAAHRRPEPLLETLTPTELAADVPAAQPTVSPVASVSPALFAVAELGRAHPRLTRVSRIERAPSGRARCRHCKEAVAQGEFRIALDVFQDGRFDPIGFIHLGCQANYFEISAEPERLLRAAAELEPADREALQLLLSR